MSDYRLYIYRVYQEQRGTKCVWSGIEKEPNRLLPFTLSNLFSEHIIIPKDEHVLRHVAKMLGDIEWWNSAGIVESYLNSSHHACTPELGIGLALNEEKWTKRWPQYEWKVLEAESVLLDKFKAVGGVGRHWNREKLKILRQRRKPMPLGCDRKLWDSLSYVRRDLGPNRPRRSNKG